MKVASFIIEARKKLGLTQKEFAELIGTSQPNICKYEKDINMPPADVLLKIQELTQTQDKAGV